VFGRRRYSVCRAEKVTALSTAYSPSRGTTRSRKEADRGYGHLAPLLSELASLPPDDSRRAELREELVAGYLSVVRHIARRYAGRGEPLADLEQVGAIGLLNALDRFDPERGIDFLSYAIPTITGEMRRHFRDHTWSMRVPRPLKDLQGPIRQAVAALSNDLGRAPRPTEIAAQLGVAVELIIEALNAQQAYACDSLDKVVGDTGTTRGDLLSRVDESLATAEYRDALRKALDELPERERTILVLRFFGDMTQTQIATRVGLSQMHVSRLLTQILATLRADLEAD
jgi:RNA polymerase sigma-B factor